MNIEDMKEPQEFEIFYINPLTGAWEKLKTTMDMAKLHEMNFTEAEMEDLGWKKLGTATDGGLTA